MKDRSQSTVDISLKNEVIAIKLRNPKHDKMAKASTLYPLSMHFCMTDGGFALPSLKTTL